MVVHVGADVQVPEALEALRKRAALDADVKPAVCTKQESSELSCICLRWFLLRRGTLSTGPSGVIRGVVFGRKELMSSGSA